MSTSTAKKAKKNQTRNNKKFNDSKNNNKRSNGKGFGQKQKLNLNNNRNRNGNGNNHRQNGNMNNKMNRRGKFNRPMNRAMMHPQLTPMQGMGFYNQPMNSYYQQAPPAPQMPSPGPPRDMYYNRPLTNNGQFYGSNGPAPSQMYSGINTQPLQQAQPNFYQQPYNRGPMNKIGQMQSPQQMYQQYGTNMNTQTQPMGYPNYGGYGNGQMLSNGNNKYVGFYQ